MADQGRWFKLWVGWDTDPDLANLSLDDQARWCRFGTYLKKHGTKGKLRVSEPGQALQDSLRVSSFEAVHSTLKKFPNCTVTPVTTATVTFIVTWKNWEKYQGDMSRDRVAMWREKRRRVTEKSNGLRGEEKRREENKKRREIPPIAPVTDSPPIQFKINASILGALDRAMHLGHVAKLRDPAWWQAQVRANGHVEFADELLKAEAWLVTKGAHLYRDKAKFLHNWFGRVPREAGNG